MKTKTFIYTDGLKPSQELFSSRGTKTVTHIRESTICAILGCSSVCRLCYINYKKIEAQPRIHNEHVWRGLTYIYKICGIPHMNTFESPKILQKHVLM